MSRWRSQSVIVAAFTLLLGLYAVRHVGRPPQIHFDSIEHFRAFAESADLFFHDGSAANSMEFYDNFFVADRPITWDDVSLLHGKTNCGRAPPWQGIAWAISVREDMVATVAPHTIGGHVRVWGKVLVAGDEAILDRLESHYRD